MLSPLQKLAAQAIVNVFETGRLAGDYGRVTLLPGDPGHLTYGRSQTTLASGNLHLLIKAYCAAQGAYFAAALRPYLERLSARDLSLDDELNLRGLLRQAGADAAMRAAQDAFFDRVYWAPAEQAAAGLKAASALGTAIVYDSHIHGSWAAMRDSTRNQMAGKGPAEAGEHEWFAKYLEVRRAWLAGHPNELLHKTVYRMDAFQGLAAEGRWALELPFTLRGVRFSAEALQAGDTAVTASAAAADEVVLKLEEPQMRGERVRELQRALAARGIAVSGDGVFGAQTDAAVRAFQAKAGLGQDGIVGPATWSALHAGVAASAAAGRVSSPAGRKTSPGRRGRRAR